MEVLGVFPSCSLETNVHFVHALSGVLAWERFRFSPHGLGMLHSTGCYSLPFLSLFADLKRLLQLSVSDLDVDMQRNA